MKQKRKIVSVILCGLLCISLLSGCQNTSTFANKEEETVKIVSTIFPQYDWVREIIGDDSNIENTYLLDSGIDLHSFQPTAEDIHTILSSDVFIYVGGESEEWVLDALAQDTDSKVRAISLMDVLSSNLKEEEMIEGMQEEEEEGESEEQEYDEHVWMSLRNAELICESIKDVLVEVLPDQAAEYEENAEAYISKLEEADERMQSMVETSAKKTIVVGDRFPFRYLADDYQLDYYAAFSGCSAETEASFETITFLAGQMDANQLGSIIVTETSDQKIAETVLENTKDYGQQIIVLNSMQSVVKDDAQSLTYLDAMNENYETLKQALEG